MLTGQDLLNRAATREGEEYVLGANTDTSNPDEHGPWDCAEFVTWVVYQVTGKLLGCVDNEADPADCDAYTGAWARDVKTGTVKGIPVEEAMKIPGAILLRAKTAERCGHIVFSDGEGGTIEAYSHADGVCRLESRGRTWNYGILIREVEY